MGAPPLFIEEVARSAGGVLNRRLGMASLSCRCLSFEKLPCLRGAGSRSETEGLSLQSETNPSPLRGAPLRQGSFSDSISYNENIFSCIWENKNKNRNIFSRIWENKNKNRNVFSRIWESRNKNRNIFSRIWENRNKNRNIFSRIWESRNKNRNTFSHI